MNIYLKASNVKKFGKENKRNFGKEAIAILESHVYQCLKHAASIRDGNKKSISGLGISQGIVSATKEIFGS